MENSIIVNGVKYVRESDKIIDTNGYEYVIIRTYSAGVFAGYLKSRNGKEVELVNARRLYYWKGAATLSQLAMEGVKNPSECKFAMPVNNIVLTEAIEVIPVTDIGKISIDGVAIWKM